LKITSLDGGSAVDLLPCPDDHDGALHAEVILWDDDRGVRRYPDRYVCPGGPVEADAWLQGLLAGLVAPGGVLQLCETLQLTLIAQEPAPSGRRVQLLVRVPDLDQPAEAVDAVVVELGEPALVELASWWHCRALTVLNRGPQD
jgi:hypothetical protein